MIHHERDRHKHTGTLITCSECGTGGGTLVKVDDHYEHQDKATCRMMQLRIEEVYHANT